MPRYVLLDKGSGVPTQRPSTWAAPCNRLFRQTFPNLLKRANVFRRYAQGPPQGVPVRGTCASGNDMPFTQNKWRPYGWLLGALTGLLLASGGVVQAQSAEPLATETASLNPALYQALFENFSLFGGIEASREPQDLGINANFGANLSANLGVPLLPEWGVGAQAGSGVNLSHAGVKVLRDVEGTTVREQWFNTAGLFQRRRALALGPRLRPGSGVRSQQLHDGPAPRRGGRLKVTDADEFGVWGTADAFGDTGRVLDTKCRVDPISQVNVYWQHQWESTAQTCVWVGSGCAARDRHHPAAGHAQHGPGTDVRPPTVRAAQRLPGRTSARVTSSRRQTPARSTPTWASPSFLAAAHTTQAPTPSPRFSPSSTIPPCPSTCTGVEAQGLPSPGLGGEKPLPLPTKPLRVLVLRGTVRCSLGHTA